MLYVEWCFQTVKLQTFLRKQGSAITPSLRTAENESPAYNISILTLNQLHLIHWHYTDILHFCVTTSCRVISIVQVAVSWTQFTHPGYGSKRLVRKVGKNVLPYLMKYQKSFQSTTSLKYHFPYFFHRIWFTSISIHQILNTSLAVPLLIQNVTQCLQPLRSLTMTTTYAPRLSIC